MSNTVTVSSALFNWLTIIQRSKSKNTYQTYSYAASVFRRSLVKNIPIASLSEKHYETLLAYLKKKHPHTEKLIATIIALFFEYLSAKRIHTVNMDSIRYMRRNETRKAGKRLRKMDMPALEEIDEKVMKIEVKDDFLLARAKAFVILLSRSGLRASEAAGLKMSDLDTKTLRGIIIGKGDKEGYFIIDEDVISAIREYHRVRKAQSPYVFVSHSLRNSWKPPRPIDSDTARRDVEKICSLLLERSPKWRVTPHQFRHYFVSQVWKETGDIKMAQELARHDNITTTENYIHADEKDMNKAAGRLKKRRV